MIRFLVNIFLGCLVILIIIPAILVRGFNWKEKEPILDGQETVDLEIDGKIITLP